MTGMPGDDTGGEQVDAWARSGAMALTGRGDGPPLGPPAPLVRRLQALSRRLRHRSSQLGAAVDLDPLALLAERAAIAGLARQGRASCGGAARLLRSNDGWIAVSLAREDDIELLPAWLEGPPVGAGEDPWDLVAQAARTRPASALVERASLLGLPVSALPALPSKPPRSAPPLPPLPLRAHRVRAREVTRSLEHLLVVDLGSLWAAPLCGALLADAGATVVKVESTGRPDGARGGPAPFFDLLNAGKRSFALDLLHHHGRHVLRDLLTRADVVIESTRPRALHHLGIDADALLAHDDGPRVWVSITAHGREGTGRDRVGFGDDAAVAGGLVAWEGALPCFCADAIADPVTGLVAAVGALEALAAGGTWLLDVSLAGVAASLAGPTLLVPPGLSAAPPVARRRRGTAPALGADTASVLDELQLAA